MHVHGVPKKGDYCYGLILCWPPAQNQILKKTEF